MKVSNLVTLFTAAVFSAGILAAADIVPADYPLKKCPVSDEKLGGMGKPVKVTSEGTDVYLCCKNCVKDFNKEPAKYVQMVKDAAAKK
jgi:YHS domain-containing protein